MIQRLVPLLGLDKERLSLTEEQFSTLMGLQTFDISIPEVTTAVPVSTEELLSTLSTSTPATSASEAPASGDEDSANTSTATEAQSIETTTVSSTSSTTVSTEFPDNFREPRDEVITESDEVTASTGSTTTTESSTTTVASTSTEAAVVSEESSTTDAIAQASSEASTEETTLTTIEEPEVVTEVTDVDVSTEKSTRGATDTSTTETVTETTTSTTEASTTSTTEVSTTKAATESTRASTEVTTKTEESTSTSTDMSLAHVLSGNELLAFSTFLDYEPDTDNFDKIPALHTVRLTCDMLTASGDAASSISSTHLASMTSADLINCLETLGRIHWTEATAASIWRELKAKVALFQDPSLKPIKRDLMIQLHNLLPAIATYDANLIDVTEDNIDGISLIGL